MQGTDRSAVQLARAELVSLYRGTKHREQFTRFCPATLSDGKQTQLLVACAAAALDAGEIPIAESFAKRAVALLDSEPATMQIPDRVRAFLTLAEAGRKQGHLDDARKAADQALALCVQYLGKYHALKSEVLMAQVRVLDDLKMKAESKRARKAADDIAAANKGGAANSRLTSVRLLSKSEPGYPTEAKAARAEGKIVFLCEIGIDGKSLVLAPLNRLGFGFEGEALATLQRWRFEPMRKDGHPVASVATIEVNFKLR